MALLVKKLSCIALTMLCIVAVTAAQGDKDKDKDKKDAKTATGTPVLWEPTDVPSFDTSLGPGGADMQPDLSHITFVEEEKGGFSKKYKIKDGAGHTWVAKVGPESQSETAAVRLVSAVGYKTDINYLVPHMTIPTVGDFDNVRLEARPDDIKRMGTWSWKDNPFKGTKEFQGLKIMMAFLNNWDMKEANNVILEKDGKDYYAISDLGATFGKSGPVGLPIFWRIGRNRNQPESYADSEFLKGVQSGKIKFAYEGKNRSEDQDISVASGRWLADLLVQLTDKQIHDAFLAANYSDADISQLSVAVKARIRALDIATRAPTARQ
ncbi:MAG: hypothetical protein ACJ73D_00175 [Pyrinomonadaceae bacterium]